MAAELSPNSKIIWETIEDLTTQEQPVTREVIQEITGLKLTTIDSHIKDLIEDGKLSRVIPGVFRIVYTFPPTRIMSKTVLPNGLVKLEIGDEVLTLTPKEDRALAGLQAGVVGQFAAIESGKQTTFLVTQLAEEVKKMQNKILAMQQKYDQRQLELATK